VNLHTSSALFHENDYGAPQEEALEVLTDCLSRPPGGRDYLVPRQAAMG